MSNWQPSATLGTLRKRAELLSEIRRFFSERRVLEVDVPLVGSSTVTDVYMQVARAQVTGRDCFLQTSPEYFMKRLLAAGSGDIYYLGKAVRDDDVGRRHNPEFTMLEWYRLGLDDHKLMLEVAELIAALGVTTPCAFKRYQDLFKQATGLNPHLCRDDELRVKAQELVDISWKDADRATWLDLLFTHTVEPSLSAPTFVYDYPVAQSALARVETNEDQISVAKRFELYWQGVELANGYWELIDPDVQRQRFNADLEARSSQGLEIPEVDQKFLSAIEAGLPECAGVALGVDRLLMVLGGYKCIDEVMAFSFERL